MIDFNQFDEEKDLIDINEEIESYTMKDKIQEEDYLKKNIITEFDIQEQVESNSRQFNHLLDVKKIRIRIRV